MAERRQGNGGGKAVLSGNDAVEHEAHYGKKQAEEQGPPEIPDLKAGNQRTRQEDEQGIQHKNEQPQGYDSKGEGEDYENRPYDGVYEAKHKGSDDRRTKAFHCYAGEEVRTDQNHDGSDEPVDEQVHYS